MLLWLIMEDVCGPLENKHAALYSDNSPTVSWVNRLAARSPVAAQLVRALAFRLKLSKASPLSTLHIRGILNSMTDIPSRSFGSNLGWHCTTDDELLTLFTRRFPVPKGSWTVYRPSRDICTRVTSILQMRHFTLEEWKLLPKPGEHTGTIGSAMSTLFEWTLTYRTSPSPIKSDASQGTPHELELDTTVEENKLELQLSVRRSLPLARRSRWPAGETR